LVEWLDRMRFMMRVDVTDVTSEVAVSWRPAARQAGAPYSGYEFVPRDQLSVYAAAAGPAAGMWAFEALRIARGEPRLGLDTDGRTIPNEAGWIGTAVHLDKGCYRGQETVARVHNLGRPPRRLVLLHLDGSDSELPSPGAPLELDGRQVGRLGTTTRHFEIGPIALALVKRQVPDDAQLVADGVTASVDTTVSVELPESAAREAAEARANLLRLR
jgi:folate-binding protein YgfZ